MSPDTVSAQAKFKEKFELPFTLLADTDHAVAEQYGVWKEKMNYGKKYMGVERTTFLIDRNGRLMRVFEKVTPKGHAEGEHGPETHARFIEQLRSAPQEEPESVLRERARELAAREGKRRLVEGREQHDEAEKGSESNKEDRGQGSEG